MDQERLDPHELAAWKEFQEQLKKVQAKLEGFSELVTIHWKLNQGDTIDPMTGIITRKPPDSTTEDSS